MSITLAFHESQWPEVVAARLRASLEAGVVPGRYLYDSLAQSARWLAYHEAWSPARTARAVQALYDQAFEAALAALPAGAVQYVSLGCGGGQKDARWARLAGPRAGRTVLTDTSPALVLTAHRNVREAQPEAGLPVPAGLVIDLTAWPDRAAYGVQDETPVVWSCLGLLPNFAPDQLLPYLRRLMGPADLVILSANLSPPYPDATASILPQYDNPLARAWYDGALLELGFPLDGTERRMRTFALDDAGGSWRMRYAATASEPLTLQVHGTPVHLPAGREVEVFHSTRYTGPYLEALCANHGLTQRAAHVDPDGQEGVYLFRR